MLAELGQGYRDTETWNPKGEHSDDQQNSQSGELRWHRDERTSS